MEDITKYKQILLKVAADTNQAFLALLLDFLGAISEEERKRFFYENRGKMDTLVGCYCDFKDEFYEKQEKKIKEYLSRIRSATKTTDWKIYKGRVLYIYLKYIKGKKRGHRIGIECGFEKETSENPLGEFHIYVASWAQENFGSYESNLKEAFPYRDINEDKTAKDRAFILVKKFEPEKTERIINALSDTYNKLKKIIKEHEDA